MENKRIKSYPGEFLHAVDLKDWYPCYNLALSGRLSSPDFFAALDPALREAHSSIKSYSIVQLRKQGVPMGVPSPTASRYVSLAAIVRRGGHIGMGINDTKWFSKDEENKILETGDIEIEFEKTRREVAPQAVSRLSCLWVAENSENGRALFKSLFGDKRLILRVYIPAAFCVTKGDNNWFIEYNKKPKIEYIKNYWNGQIFNNADPRWEYLVDGMIMVDDPQNLNIIREQGAHLELQKNPQDIL